MSSTIVWKIKSFAELTAFELHQILQARIDVFVVEQNCPYNEVDGDDPNALHLWGELDQEIVAYCRIFKPGIKYKEASIGRVLTPLKFRKNKLGKRLMNFAIQIISSQFRTSEITISAQDYLIAFYTDLGFRSTAKSYLEDNIPHTEMKKF
ncbi:GNAT family N-acetyltransferase [Chryseobacterium sp. SNU WT5]|uniref:GNAT family N-acetyltransferase n=1 Tax=Chryseobacterium sp. SNU WT5 TaxID=2594269 RepID=UPI00117DFD73|nr:GNAT family N-acetyltransferase [Chryseobacterium sp. SNU WT5]QDP85388.1 GNAT family N-acetyltransferase [Chryseobacterium sp. SNU WT5]